MKLQRIDYENGYLWVADKKERPSTKDFTFWGGLLFYPLSAIYDDSLKVVAQSPNLLIPNVPYVEFEEDVERLAEQSALDSSDECTKDNHSYDCPCAAHEEGFIKGYTAAQSKGIYSENDLRKAFDEGISTGAYDWSREHEFKELVASLNQPPLKIEIEMEQKLVVKGNADCFNEYDYSPATYQKDGKVYLKVKNQ